MRLEQWWRKDVVNGLVKVSGVRAVYLNNLLRGLAGSMVGIFFPVYVYLWGFETGGLAFGLKVLILSIALERAGVLLFSMSLGKLVYMVGFKLSILLSAVTLSIWFLLPAVFPQSLWLIVVLSIISSVTIPVYWFARLSILSMDGKKDGFGSEASMLGLIDQTSSILGPFVGGVLVATGGFGTLFGVATFFCILSAVPIFFIGDYKIRDGISLSGFEEWLLDKREHHIHISSFGQGLANFVDAYFWPLFIFVMVGSFTILGTITSVTFGLSSVAVYLAGRTFDKKRAMGGNEDEREYTKSTTLLALATFFRPLFVSVGALFASDAIFRVVSPFWGVDYDSYLYTVGKRSRSALEFYTYREIVYSAARVIGPLLLLFFVNSTYFWWVTFGMGSVGTMMTMGMRRES